MVYASYDRTSPTLPQVLPPVRLDAKGPRALHLVAKRHNLPGDEFEAPRQSFSPVVLLEAAHLETVGSSLVDHVQASSFYLGAASGSKQRNKGVWYYRPEWVFFGRAEAQRQMNSVYGRGHLVCILHLPMLAFFAGPSILLVTELWTDEPHKRALTRLRPMLYDPTTTDAFPQYFRDGRFHPATLRDAVDCVRLGQPSRTQGGWLFGLVLREELDVQGRGLLELAPAYTISTRGYRKSTRAASGSLLGWSRRPLQVADKHVKDLAHLGAK